MTFLEVGLIILVIVLWSTLSNRGRQINRLNGEVDRATTQVAELFRQSEADQEARLKADQTAKEVSIKITAHQATVNDIANHYINDRLKSICDRVTPSNLESSRTKMEKSFDLLKKNHIQFAKSDEKKFYEKINQVFKDAVRKEDARIRQQMIKEQIRDEQRAEKERQDELRRLEQSEKELEAALKLALKNLKDEHSDEIAKLRQQLEEVQANSERAKSMAQLTKAGHVYVISNLGSFGQDTYKIGMTRRLEPMDRVKELGDASVPFPFDVHLMISCDDAPALESNLHRDLHAHRFNKVNLRKEFFKAQLEEIVASVQKHHGKVEYQATAEAFEFNETQLINERGNFDLDHPYSKDLEDQDEAEAA